VRRVFILSVLLLLYFCFSSTAQQQIFGKVPKQISFEVGYRNVFSSKRLPTDVNSGYGILFDYAWQLSGFDGSRSAAFISVPLGYTSMAPANDTTARLSMLCYGWTVRHEIGHGKRFTPYFGYGLLLNQMRIGDITGSVMGHQTQFEFGVNYATPKRLKYFAKLQYSYTSFPQLNEEKRIVMNFADVRVGVRF